MTDTAIGFALLGIVMLVLIIYAGFLWMTSGGDQTQVDRAKTMLRNAVIGVIIILSSWALTTFVINALINATTGGGGAGGPGGGPAPGRTCDRICGPDGFPPPPRL